LGDLPPLLLMYDGAAVLLPNPVTVDDAIVVDGANDAADGAGTGACNAAWTDGSSKGLSDSSNSIGARNF